MHERIRKELGLPEFSENTWRAGLDRMLLGYALPGQDEKMFMGILPYDRVEGGEVSILGNFLGFLERLFASVKKLGELFMKKPKRNKQNLPLKMQQ